MSNNPVHRHNNNPIHNTPPPKESSLLRTVLKVCAIVIIIAAIAAVTATAVVGLPVAIPVGIALSTLGLESIILGIYKCCIPEGRPYERQYTPPPPRRKRSYDPSLPFRDVTPQSVTPQKIINILSSKPSITSNELQKLRTELLSSYWQFNDNLEQEVEERYLQLKHQANSANSIFLTQPGCNNILLLSNTIIESDRHLSILQPNPKIAYKHDKLTYPKGRWNVRSITKEDLKEHEVAPPPLDKPLDVLAITEYARNMYRTSLDQVIYSGNFKNPEHPQPGGIAFDMPDIKYSPFKASERLLIQEALLLGFCMAITEGLQNLNNKTLSGQSIITLVNIRPDLKDT